MQGLNLCVFMSVHCVMLHSLSCPQLTAPDTDLQPLPIKKQAHNVSFSLLLIISMCAACAHSAQMLNTSLFLKVGSFLWSMVLLVTLLQGHACKERSTLNLLVSGLIVTLRAVCDVVHEVTRVCVYFPTEARK